MAKDKKDEKRQIVVPVTEYDQIKEIVNIALIRIISGKTKRTYQQELTKIAKTIEKYIHITYMLKEEHNKEIVTQIFGYINCFKDMKKKYGTIKTNFDKGYCKALDTVVEEFESLIYRKK